jgi:hypothetical protein
MFDMFDDLYEVDTIEGMILERQGVVKIHPAQAKYRRPQNRRHQVFRGNDLETFSGQYARRITLAYAQI